MKASIPVVVKRTLAPVLYPGNVDQKRVEVLLESVSGEVAEARLMMSVEDSQKLTGICRLTIETREDGMDLYEYMP